MTYAAVTRDTSSLPHVDGTYAVFVHLNAEKSTLYRAILSVFVAERARFTLALRPSEIHAALVATSASTLTLDEIDATLRQLRDWGNLDDSPATAEFSSDEPLHLSRRSPACVPMRTAGLRQRPATSVTLLLRHRSVTC